MTPSRISNSTCRNFRKAAPSPRASISLPSHSRRREAPSWSPEIPRPRRKPSASTSARPIIFARSSGKKEDVALINEANFQLGEILLNQAAHSPEAERPNLYAEALAAFRAVAPKEEIIALQQNKVREFVTRKAAALRANNVSLKRQLDRDNERELKKLAELQGKPDQTATAQLKMAEMSPSTRQKQ